ncbi:helix-turn-helix transcriptional regulator [Sphingomonas sp. ABOLH]|nr:helix-turn-helix transcriptional regulator [Sphingomonas sp. ABOLH]
MVAEFRFIYILRAEIRMERAIFPVVGDQLRALRVKRGWSQPALAERVGRNRARISELERDLTNNRLGRDRLTLFAEVCDALDVVPVLVPRALATEIRLQVEPTKAANIIGMPIRSAFDELFVDLGEDEEIS